jgi:GH3 auxin-responsive promoter
VNSLAAPLPGSLPERLSAAMPVWPKSIYAFGVNLLTAKAEWKLRQKRSAVAQQDRIFRELVPSLAAASYWRESGVVAGMSYDSFQARVAPRTYEQLAPAIDRMKRGEADVLWPGHCSFFAVSSGTTAGRTKYLPVTEEMLGHFSRAGLDSLLYYTVRVRHAGVFRGRHLFLGGSTVLTPLEEAKPHTAYGGDLSGITALNLPPWVERHLYEPGTTIAQMTDWPRKIEAIVARTRARDISLLAGIPSWVLILAAALREDSAKAKQRITNLQGLWPNFECFVHGGVPLGPFEEELRAILGPTVTFHEVYPASEGFIATQDAEASSGLRLMADTGLFFEFLPMADFDESRLDQLGRKVIPLADVKVGVDYALLLTTPAGLVRYVIGDVVRFTSTQPPRLQYVGRTKLQLSAFGEHVIEKEVTDALIAVCSRHRWSIVNFHVAPLFVNTRLGANRGRHEWWIELRPGTVSTPTGPQMALELDAELQRLNEDYEAKRKGGGLDAPFVRLVMPGVFEHWLKYQGKWGGQNKMPRCRSDRVIADDLARITHFAGD